MTFKEQKLKKAVTFSFDDGVTQDIRMIELLNKYSLFATFNVNSDLLSQRGILDRNGKRISHYKLHPEDVKFVYDGHEVAAHTLTHPLLPAIKDENEIIRQVENDRENLSDLVGYEVIGMAYPCGGENNDDRVAEIVKNHTGVQYARTIKSVYDFEPQTNLFRFNPSVYYLHFDKMMELGRKFVELKTDKPQIFYIWGHSYEMDFEEDYWVRMPRHRMIPLLPQFPFCAGLLPGQQLPTCG